MTKKEIITKLTMLKLQYGHTLIPTGIDTYERGDRSSLENMLVISELSSKHYLEYVPITLTNGFRGYVLTAKANKLLEGNK